MHYVLIHFDVPDVDPATFELIVDGRVRRPAALTLDGAARPAGGHDGGDDGVRRLGARAPRAAPGLGAVARRGDRLRRVDRDAPARRARGGRAARRRRRAAVHRPGPRVRSGRRAGLPAQPVDRGRDGRRRPAGLRHERRSRCPPSHGFPLRLIVPEWYGMASVKWLRSITAITEPFEGVQQTLLYRYRRSADDPGTPVTRKRPRALMAPPGMPEFLARTRHVRAGRTLVQGRAWSGPDAGQPRRVQRRRRAHVGRRAPGGAQRQARLERAGPTPGTRASRATTSSASARPTAPATPSRSTAPRPGTRAATRVNAVQRVAVRVT